MNHQPEYPTTLRQSAHSALWRQRLGLIALTLGNLLLVNTLFFAGIAHATPTPSPRPTPTSTLCPLVESGVPAQPMSTPCPLVKSAPRAVPLVINQANVPAPLLPNTTLTLRDRLVMEWGFGVVSLLALVYWRGRPS